MKLKLDQNPSRSAAELCRAAGRDVMSVRDQHLRGAPERGLWIVEPARVRIHLGADEE